MSRARSNGACALLILLWSCAGLAHGQEVTSYFELDGSRLRIDLVEVPPSDWRALINAEAVPLPEAGIRAGVASPPGGREARYRAFHIPFSIGVEAEAATLLYAGPPLPSLLIERVTIELYGLNTEHGLSMLLHSPDGVEHEFALGSLTFDGGRLLIGRTGDAVGQFTFAGLRVYAPVLEQPDNRLLLLCVGHVELSSRRSR